MEKYFGVCYYPELYPKEKQEAFIQEDIENMRRAHFNVVRGILLVPDGAPGGRV